MGVQTSISLPFPLFLFPFSIPFHSNPPIPSLYVPIFSPPTGYGEGRSYNGTPAEPGH